MKKGNSVGRDRGGGDQGEKNQVFIVIIILLDW